MKQDERGLGVADQEENESSGVLIDANRIGEITAQSIYFTHTLDKQKARYNLVATIARFTREPWEDPSTETPNANLNRPAPLRGTAGLGPKR